MSDTDSDDLSEIETPDLLQNTSQAPGPPKLSPDRQRLDLILDSLSENGWTLGKFLHLLFLVERKSSPNSEVRSSKHRAMVSKFLKGQTGFKAEDIVELMYSSPDSAPRSVRAGRQPEGTPARVAKRPDKVPMARWQLGEWAVMKVEGFVNKEARRLSGKKGGFHFTPEQMNWDFIQSFSLAKAAGIVETEASVLLRVLIASAVPPGSRLLAPNTDVPQPYLTYFSSPLASGSGSSRRDPFVIVMVACMMLMYARNLHFAIFRKITGLWLFANNASDTIFSVLSRVGLSSSYTTILSMLETLSEATQATVRLKAITRAFLIIYDNINRMIRAWDPDLGQRDTVHSGTAATYVELEDCDIEKAFDPQKLKDAQDAHGREKLDAEVLRDRIDMKELNLIMALHSLSFLVQNTPCLHKHQEFINLRFQTTHASHRMRKGRKTIIHPLATSGHDEGSTEGNKKVIDDIMLNQLTMDKEEVAKLMIIFGGDQSTVEKIRTLKKFLDTCPHGYSRYGWVLPLIQLWHMGWADLERVLSTHWGKPSDIQHGDMSTFYFTNIILRRKIKDSARPDYYPTQGFIFDNLMVEIMDCWKVYLGTDDLEGYFNTNPTDIEDLLKLANELVTRYLTTEASERALYGDTTHGFAVGSPWTPASSLPDSMDIDSDDDVEPLQGDQILANTILRMRDSMLHYEFQFAIADGDIGRAMNIMAVWTFTFTGCGKSKYSNELLELACNFEYEYSDDLQKAILNNWLCNMSGIEGCWFPMDLLQEHNIKQLKKMSERRDAGFDGKFFKQIIAYNIRAFLQANDSMKASVRLASKRGAHRRKKKEAAMKELADTMSERQLHKLRIGRTLGHIAKDDFEAGNIILSEGTRIKNFIHRTLMDAGNIQDEEGSAQVAADEQASIQEGDIPLPNMVLGGVFHTSDEGDGEPEDEDESSDIGEQ